MGGVWSDAEGAPPASWRDRDDQRCRDMVNAVYGAFSQARYEQIRENEAPVIPGGITGTRTVLRADQ